MVNRMEKAYGIIYNEDAFKGVEVPLELEGVLEHLMDNEEELITDVFDDYDDYRDCEVEYSGYARDGSNGTTIINNVDEFKKWFFDYFRYKIEEGEISVPTLNMVRDLKEIVYDEEDNGNITDKAARLMLEEVIDTLIEVGNGTTDEQLHEAANILLIFRDYWFDKKIIK